MAENNKILNHFTTRMRQLILQYKEVKKENEKLHAMVEATVNEKEQLRQQLEQANKEYNSLKIARMVEITDGDVEGAKKRLATMIREINKCIALLSEKVD